jgi:hypothetical protein
LLDADDPALDIEVGGAQGDHLADPQPAPVGRHEQQPLA